MKRIQLQNLTKKQYIVVGAGVLVLLLIITVISGNGNGEYELVTVEKRDVVEEVSVSGRVEAGIIADLGFEVSGKVKTVQVDEGDVVPAGTVLVSLDASTLLAELQTAEADVLIKQAQLSNAQTNLEDVQKQQDTLVQSAYRTLLSDDLEAVPSVQSVTVAAPTISGRYTGPEGTYKVRVLPGPGGAGSDTYELRTFGIEETAGVKISDTTATKLGTYGLFLSFPDTLENYRDTIWYIDIPNSDSSSYSANLNAYEEALQNKEVALEAAQAEVIAQQSGISITEAQLVRAQAEVVRIQAEIAKRSITAPFSGTVTQVEVDPGEIVSANTIVATVISDDGFGIEVDLPEVDSVKVNTGDDATVTLDPFGDEVTFDATVLSVNAAETLLDNVAVYEARVGFNEEDKRVASGMTATVKIQTDVRENVLALPIRAVQRRPDGTDYVVRILGEREEEVDVALGLRGSDSFVEILSSLSEGDTIMIPQ